MLKARLQTVRTEVEKPWAHAAEYRRLRRRYEEMGVALQAEGIEIESNTTFTVEEGEQEGDDSCETTLTDPDVSPMSTPADDELSARHNPYTGLEEFPIIVDETNAETDELEDLQQAEEGRFNSAMFDFEGKVEGQKDEPDNEDIFAAAVSDNVEEADQTSSENFDQSCSALVSASSEGLSDVTDKGDDDESMWRIAEAKEELRPTNDEALAARARPRVEKKTNQPKDEAQIGFSW